MHPSKIIGGRQQERRWEARTMSEFIVAFRGNDHNRKFSDTGRA